MSLIKITRLFGQKIAQHEREMLGEMFECGEHLLFHSFCEGVIKIGVKQQDASNILDKLLLLSSEAMNKIKCAESHVRVCYS